MGEINAGNPETARLLYLILFYGVETTFDGEDMLSQGLEGLEKLEGVTLPSIRLDTDADAYSRDSLVSQIKSREAVLGLIVKRARLHAVVDEFVKECAFVEKEIASKYKNTMQLNERRQEMNNKSIFMLM